MISSLTNCSLFYFNTYYYYFHCRLDFSVRTVESVVFFPRFSFILFCFFHFYVFSFPFGFSYVALFTVCTLVWYLMLYFWDKYELPALYSGQINALNVRADYSNVIASPQWPLDNSSLVAGEDAPLSSEQQSVDRERSVSLSSEDEAVTSALAGIHIEARKTVSKIRADASNPLVVESNNPSASKIRTANVRYASEGKSVHSSSAASPAESTDTHQIFPPLPARRTVAQIMKSSGKNRVRSPRVSSQESGDTNEDVGLSLDEFDSGEANFNKPRLNAEDLPQVEESARGTRIGITITPYEQQIALSRQLQAQEMEERMNKMFMPKTGSFNFFNVGASPTAGFQVPRMGNGVRTAINETAPLQQPRGMNGVPKSGSTDDFGYKKSELNVFGNNS